MKARGAFGPVVIAILVGIVVASLTTNPAYGVLAAAVTGGGLVAFRAERGRRPGTAVNDRAPRTSGGRPTRVARPDDRGHTEVERRLARAEADLEAVSGGAPLCRIGNQPRAGSVKYVEGRWAALSEVERSLRVLPGQARATANRVLEKWEHAQRTAGQQGPAWAAYRNGGVDELRSLIGDLDAASDSDLESA